jgi:hypothetical protein
VINIDKLIFFNKEGYPYNFIYDNDNDIWEGNIMFDENSTELFKTIGIYTFEKVEPFTLTSYFDFEQSQLFNWSGMTFISKTFENEIISNIESVNSDENFHTKWIYGNNFDTKYKVGTIVTFNSGETISGNHWNDFIGDYYFVVLRTKHNSFMISTVTDNKTFNDFVFSTGLTVESKNIIKIPDYGNEYLVDINNLDYYYGKKLNIINSKYNDGVKTYIDYSILNKSVYDFKLDNNISSGKIIMDITLFTERPKVYSGDVNISITNTSSTGTTIVFNEYINDLNIINIGQHIIFEKSNGKNIIDPNPIFTITKIKDKESIFNGSVDFILSSGNTGESYYLLIDNTNLNLSIYDKLYLDSYPFIPNTTNNDNRYVDIKNISIEDNKTKIEINQYIIPETGNTYEISKILSKNQINTIYASQTSFLTPISYIGESICYLTTNHITLQQDIVYSGNTNYYYENTIESLNNNYLQYLKDIGIQIYHYHFENDNYIIAESLYEYNYNRFFDITISIMDNNQNTYPLTTSGNFGYSGYTSDVYFLEIEENLKNEKINLFDNNKLNKNYKSEIIFDLNDDLLNYGFKISLNGGDYYIDYSNDSGSTSYTNQTIIKFINKFENIFYKNGFLIYSGLTSSGYSLNINSIYPNIDVIDLNIQVNVYSTYQIKSDWNKSIIISSNQLRSTYTNLFDKEFSTGMVISLDGSKYPSNNKDYNILSVTNNILQLSYQGIFFEDYNVLTNIGVREYIRKPRSYYNRDVDFVFSWSEKHIGNIFFYDFSTNQLKPYKNIDSLRYTGVKPLDMGNNNIYLNKEPNKSEKYINEPSLQQTVFDNITYRLEKLNESNSYNYTPEPLELFIGFNEPSEGVTTKELILKRIDYGLFSGTTQNNTINEFQQHFIIKDNIIEFITNDYNFNFTNYDFEIGQMLSINFTDISLTGQTLYNEYKSYKIKNITSYKIHIDNNISSFNTLELYNNSGKTFNFVLKSMPKEILKCKIYGQTEIEDERLDINLKNIGIELQKDTEFIFKDSDINEHSIDYIRLNRKRKEMLTQFTEIFDYVGAYKSLVHAIDFFGYNDLQLYEYYRNLKPDSPLYGKLNKVLIPDIFDNTIEGWESIDYIKTKYDKGYYKKTNMFNLSYRITDIFGNYSLQYSLDEVQIKLTSLVKWLRKNIIPLSSNILDITGVIDTSNNDILSHDSSTWSTKSIITDNVIGVDFYYKSTRVTNDSYLLNIDFYVLSGNTSPEYYTVNIKTYSKNKYNELIPQQNFLLNKTDYEPYSFTLNINTDPYVSIETTTYNDYGLGHNRTKMFKYDEIKNYYLINKNFNVNSFEYLNSKNGYYIIDNGRIYIIKK